MFEAEIVATAVFLLNGKRLTAMASVSYRGDKDRRRELLEKLHTAVAEKIASEVLGESLRCMTLPRP